MKRTKVMALLLAVVMILATTTVSYAYGTFCSFTETDEHDFEFMVEMACAHPHKGFYECGCGKRIYKDKIFSEECTICRKELCKKGIHCYVANIHYTDNGYSGYGECYCGKKKEFSYDKIGLSDEPYVSEGFLTLSDKVYTAKHPHKVYDMSRKNYYPNRAVRSGACGVCNLEWDYGHQVTDYNINGNVFTYDDDNDLSYYDDNDDEYSEEENNYEYDSSEDEEFYDWLEFVKELFSSD